MMDFLGLFPDDIMMKVIVDYLSYKDVLTLCDASGMLNRRYCERGNDYIWQRLYFRDVSNTLPQFDDTVILKIQYISTMERVDELMTNFSIYLVNNNDNLDSDYLFTTIVALILLHAENLAIMLYDKYNNLIDKTRLVYLFKYTLQNNTMAVIDKLYERINEIPTIASLINEAIKVGNIYAFTKFLDNIESEAYEGIIISTIKSKNSEMIDIILNKHKFTKYEMENIIYNAVRYGNLEILSKFIDVENITPEEVTRLNLLHASIRYNNIDVFDKLFYQAPEYYSNNFSHYSEAIITSNIPIFDILISHNTEPLTYKSSKMDHILYILIEHPDIEMLSRLIKLKWITLEDINKIRNRNTYTIITELNKLHLT